MLEPWIVKDLLRFVVRRSFSWSEFMHSHAHFLPVTWFFRVYLPYNLSQSCDFLFQNKSTSSDHFCTFWVIDFPSTDELLSQAILNLFIITTSTSCRYLPSLKRIILGCCKFFEVFSDFTWFWWVYKTFFDVFNSSWERQQSISKDNLY